MAPIPQIQKKKPQRNKPTVVTTDEVFDQYGRTLSQRLKQQTRKDRSQDEETEIVSQHSRRSLGESGISKVIFRDVFPGRKYILIFSDTSWINNNSIQVGWTRPNEYHDIGGSPFTAPIPDNRVELDLTDPNVNYTGLQTIEVRIYGAPYDIDCYLEDSSSAADLQSQIDDLVERIEAHEEAVGIPYSGTNSLDERVTDLET